jgi:hypothetical protein
MFSGALVIWPVAPDRIPAHWSFDGSVDRWGGKIEGLLGIPLLALAIYLLMRYLPRIDPGRANYARFGGAYTAIRAGIVILMAVVYAAILFGYSYVVWRADPEKQPPAGTQPADEE